MHDLRTISAGMVGLNKDLNEAGELVSCEALTLELRARLAYDGKLLGAVCHVFLDSVLGWYRRRFAARGLASPTFRANGPTRGPRQQPRCPRKLTALRQLRRR